MHWSAKIHLKGFSEDHMKMYLRRVCTFYDNSNENKIHQIKKDSVDNQEIMRRTTDVTNTGNTSPMTIKGTEREKLAPASNLTSEIVPLLEVETHRQAEITFNHGKEKRNNMKTGERFVIVYNFFCNNDILKKFQSTPHLLFLMINIKSSALTNEIPQLHNVAITNLATLLQCVITCLEITIGFWSQEKLDELNSFLGKVAFKTLSEGRPFKFENSSSSKDIPEYTHTALEIGLLQKSQIGDSGTGAGVCDFTFPSHHGMNFCHNSIRDYLAAYYISKNPESLEILKKKMKTCSKDRKVWLGTLSFSCLFDRTAFEELCEVLQKCKLYDCLIDCLCDKINNEEVISVIRKVSRDHIVISHTNEHHHIEAVKLFFQACRRMQIQLKSISFANDWFLTNLEAIEMPEVENVELKAMSLSESEFISCLKWFLNKKFTCNLRFAACKIPFNLSAETKSHIKSLRGSYLQVHRIDVIGTKEVTDVALNFATGSWTL